jgi:hypothetical protein
MLSSGLKSYKIIGERVDLICEMFSDENDLIELAGFRIIVDIAESRKSAFLTNR